MGHRTRYEWDPLNQLTKIIDPLGQTTQLTYDPNGNSTGVRDAKNNLTQYAPDTMDRPLTRTDALLHAATVLLYDENGNPRQVRDRKGQVTTTTYDPLNRPALVTWADSSTTTLTWDLGNRLTQLVDSISGTITRQWDQLDRLQYEQTPQGRVDYTYDNAGRRQTMTVLGQGSVVSSWDNADRLQSLTQGSAVVLLGYDTANRRTSVTFPNGILATYAYNARDLTGITFTLGATTLGTLTYTTDADGRRTLVGGTWARATLPTALTSAIYNANNQQTKFGTKTLTYDLNGNLTKDGTSPTYTWDARDRLSATSANNSTFQYDPLGRRTKKVVSNTTTRFHYDGDNPVQELNATGTVLANLLTGLGIDEFFTRTNAAGTRTLLGDALGSTLALADNAGALQTTYTYEPFGASTATGQTNTNTYQFTGRENDGTGLDYYRARYYSPSRQRFISEDPIGFAGGDANLYAYAFNRPTSFTDSSGEVVDPVSWTALGIACGSGAVLGVAATWAMAGRKPTLAQMGSGAVMGCGAATLGLVSWIAASGAVVAGVVAGGGIGTDVALVASARAAFTAQAGAALVKAEPVGSALKSDAFHRAASYVRADAAASGTHFQLPNGTLTQMLGELNGQAGRFEYIVNRAGQLTHQFFVPGGGINGLPIVP